MASDVAIQLPALSTPKGHIGLRRFCWRICQENEMSGESGAHDCVLGRPEARLSAWVGVGPQAVSLYHVELIYTYLHYQVGITRNKRAQIQADLTDLCVLSKTECETGQCQEGNTWSKHRLSILPGSAMSQKVKTSSMKHQQYSQMATLQVLIE